MKEPYCLKLLISKMLGYLIILGSLTVKLPQILSIIKDKSAQGVSFSMFYLELIAYSITLSYNVVKKNAFSTWGETLFLLIQTFALLVIMNKYSFGINKTFVSFTVVWIASLIALIGGSLSNQALTLLQSSTIIIFTMSKIPQVITNFKTGNTGKLAFLTFFLNFAGSAARVYTTSQEVNDPLIMTSAIIGTILNGIISIQIIFYGDSTKKSEKTK